MRNPSKKIIISQTGMKHDMFCDQCEQTAKGTEFTKIGICGKQPVFTTLQDLLLAAPGFNDNEEEKFITIGFAIKAFMSVADKVIEAGRSVAIRLFLPLAGCYGYKHGRNCYTEFAEAVPDDCVIPTPVCGKYRFNKLEFGDIGHIPRLPYVGQCNDSYSAMQIATAFANAFDTDANGPPLSFIISWYERKAAKILVALLHLVIKDIHLGPSLPAFVSPALLDVLVKNFNIMPIIIVEKKQCHNVPDRI